MTTRTPLVDQGKLLQKAERLIPGGCLGMMVLPRDLRMVMVRGQASKVYDAAGKEYLDYMLGSGPLLLGHCRPEVVEAVQREAALGSTYFALHEPAIRLAETMVEAVPCGEAIRFQTTGSEATFAAVRISRAFTGRDKVLKFEGGWHGGHDLGQLSGAPAEPRAIGLSPLTTPWRPKRNGSRSRTRWLRSFKPWPRKGTPSRTLACSATRQVAGWPPASF